MKNLKWCFIVVLLAVLASPAKAQYYRGDQECWNPRAGHFEAVRPGERQNDLDYRRCRPVSEDWGYRDSSQPRECWNPRAGHFEGVRPGEQQSDLDFRRCRPVYSGGYHYRPENNPSEPDYARECWNPRAGHFETVRPGERQDDLDFRRCRPTGDYGARGQRECWNPRAGHFEAVRPGDRQDDLDFSRCRPRF